MKMFIPWDDRMEWKIAEGFGIGKVYFGPYKQKGDKKR